MRAFVFPSRFGDSDAASERVAVRILEVLSRFEVGDLSTKVITQVLVDDAIHTALGKAEDKAAEVAIVKEGLLSVEAELKVKLEKTQEEAQTFRSITEQQSSQIGELEKDVREGSATVEELQRELRNAGGSLAERDKVLSELLRDSVIHEIGPEGLNDKVRRR